MPKSISVPSQSQQLEKLKVWTEEKLALICSGIADSPASDSAKLIFDAAARFDLAARAVIKDLETSDALQFLEKLKKRLFQQYRPESADAAYQQSLESKLVSREYFWTAAVLALKRTGEEASNTVSAERSIQRRHRPLQEREKTIRQAIREGLTGIHYANYLDMCGLTTPIAWRNEDPHGAASHAKAYKIPHWRDLLHKEKSRVKRKMP